MRVPCGCSNRGLTASAPSRPMLVGRSLPSPADQYVVSSGTWPSEPGDRGGPPGPADRRRSALTVANICPRRRADGPCSPDGCGFSGLADRLLGRGEHVVVVACAWFAGDFLQAAARGLGQHEGEQCAEDRDPRGEQQRAAQAKRALQDGEEEHADERAEL